MMIQSPKSHHIVILCVIILGVFTTGCNGKDDTKEGLPVLKKNLDVDLNTLESLAVLDDAVLHKKEVVTGLAGLDAEGNIVGLELLETTTGESAPYQPWPDFIVPTTSWILLRVHDLNINIRNPDLTYTEVVCSALAARRIDGALFCSSLGFVSYNGDNLYSDRTVKDNKIGDIIYVISYDQLDQNILYRLDMDVLDGPTATHMQDLINVQQFIVNASGDLLVRYQPSSYDPESQKLRIYPVDDSTPLDLEIPQTEGWTYFHGVRDTPTEDDYYILEGDSLGEGFTGVIHQITKTGAGFEVQDFPFFIPGASHCQFVQNLGGQLHVICGLHTALLFENGEVIAEPTLVPIPGIDRTFEIVGMSFRFASDKMMIFGALEESHRFIRMTGTGHEVALLDPDISVLHMALSESGTIDFTGRLMSTNEMIMGTVPSDSTEIIILQIEGLNVTESPNFTRIN